MRTRIPAFASIAVILSTPLQADFLTGRVVDANGVGVSGVDIDAKDLSGGGDPPLTNAGTDPNGFFTVGIPNGLYRITFTPPAPPVTTHLVNEVDDVLVVGTKNLGNVALPAGVSVGAHVVNASLLPVPGVNIDVIDLSTGDNLTLPNDTTNASGDFLVAVPSGAIELRLDASGAGETLASKTLLLAPVSSTVLPDQVLAPGFFVAGVVQGPGGVQLGDVDLDAHDSTSGAKLYTPGDSTNGSGAFSFVVPAGTFDFTVCPESALLLVGQGVDSVSVSANVDLGTLALSSGVLLLGNLKTWGGVNVAGGDIDVAFTSGAKVTTCNDNTDVAGNYAVVVPTGNLQVTFSPPSWSLALGRDVRAITVSGTQILNGVLPLCPSPSNYGTGLAGTGGAVPHLAGSGGAPSAGNAGLGLGLSGGVGGGICVLITSAVQLDVPLFGGTLLAHIDPSVSSLYSFLLGGTPGVAGAGTASFDFPNLSPFVGITAYCQFLVRDFGAPAGWALSDGLQFTICP